MWKQQYAHVQSIPLNQVLPIDFLLQRLTHTSNQEHMGYPAEFRGMAHKPPVLIRSDTIVCSLSKILEKINEIKETEA